MTGIHIELASIFDDTTKKGFVEFKLNDTKVQMDLPTARGVLASFHQAIEAAVSDELMYLYLVKNVGLDDDAAGKALLEFRELRQGSRDAVNAH
jgi:hypothetical protein